MITDSPLQTTPPLKSDKRGAKPQQLSEQERRRFDRQLKLDTCGERGQVTLKNARVAVIGAGGLGCTVLTSLASTGVGEIRLFDFDRISLSNLHRQPLYTDGDIGKSKAEVAKRALKKINPHCHVIAYDQALRRYQHRHDLQDLDLIIDCTDRFAARANISSLCVELSIPHCYASVSGTDGQVALFEPKSACFRCLFPRLPSAGLIQSCDQGGVLGGTAQMVAAIQAQVAIDYLLRQASTESSLVNVNLISTLPFSISRLTLNKDLQCQNCSSPRPSDSTQNKEPFPIPISSIEVKAKLSDSWKPLIIDVREKDELKAGMINGAVSFPTSSLKHLQSSELRESARDSEDHKQTGVNIRELRELILRSDDILVYCQRGPRAERAALQLHQLLKGWFTPCLERPTQKSTVVYELVGGYSGWRDQEK